jgi:hypothetical protein
MEPAVQLFSRRHERTTGQPHTGRTPAPAPSPRFRPQLEALEGRDVPSHLTSHLTVTNTLDSGKGSLRDEIAHASQNATIVFDLGTGSHTITLTSGELDITTGLTIEGPGAGQLTISGGNHSRVFDVNAPAPVVLSGLTISNGTAFPNNAAIPFWGDGGGILNLSTLTLSGCVVSGNTADSAAPSKGGGIYNAGTLTLNGCTVSNNYTNADLAPAFGGGIYNAGTLTVTSSIVTGNYGADGGGGIYNAGTLTVTNSTFSSNSSFDSSIGYYISNIFGPYVDGGGNTFVDTPVPR